MVAVCRVLPESGLPEYRVTAVNASVHSDNKIHEDTVARQYGFAGGLVPGVTVYAYMTRPVVEVFGADFVERGVMTARFFKPFYDGEAVICGLAPSESEPGAFDITATDEGGDVRASGVVRLRRDGDSVPDATSFLEAPLPPRRPPASAEAFAAAPILGALHETWDGGDGARRFLDEVSDDHSLYRGGSAVAHPGYLIRKANSILAENVVLGPSIHVSSDVVYFASVSDGERLSTRGKVLDVFERKGHRFVVLDVLMVKDAGIPVMSVRHTAIYEPRKLPAA